MERYPKRLNRCPLVEVTFEIRFVSTLPEDAIFGIVYQALEPIIQKTKPILLPITNLPAEVRKTDPNLKFQPHYQIQINNWVIAIGPRTLLFSNRETYVGWDEYKAFILSACDLLFKAKIIKHVNRTGLRYINVFNGSLFKDAKVKVQIGNDFLSIEETAIHTTIKTHDAYNICLQLNNNVLIGISNHPPKKSSLIDIDVFQEESIASEVFQNKISEIMEKSHTLEKRKFFNLLTSEFIKELEPIF